MDRHYYKYCLINGAERTVAGFGVDSMPTVAALAEPVVGIFVTNNFIKYSS